MKHALRRKNLVFSVPLASNNKLFFALLFLKLGIFFSSLPYIFFVTSPSFGIVISCHAHYICWSHLYMRNIHEESSFFTTYANYFGFFFKTLSVLVRCAYLMGQLATLNVRQVALFNLYNLNMIWERKFKHPTSKVWTWDWSGADNFSWELTFKYIFFQADFPTHLFFQVRAPFFFFKVSIIFFRRQFRTPPAVYIYFDIFLVFSCSRASLKRGRDRVKKFVRFLKDWTKKKVKHSSIHRRSLVLITNQDIINTFLQHVCSRDITSNLKVCAFYKK